MQEITLEQAMAKQVKISDIKPGMSLFMAMIHSSPTQQNKQQGKLVEIEEYKVLERGVVIESPCYPKFTCLSYRTDKGNIYLNHLPMNEFVASNNDRYKNDLLDTKIYNKFHGYFGSREDCLEYLELNKRVKPIPEEALSELVA